MRTFTLDLDALSQLINGREQQENWLDLESGSVLTLPAGDHYSDERQQIELDPERYSQVPNLDVPVSYTHL